MDPIETHSLSKGIYINGQKGDFRIGTSCFFRKTHTSILPHQNPHTDHDRFGIVHSIIFWIEASTDVLLFRVAEHAIVANDVDGTPTQVHVNSSRMSDGLVTIFWQEVTFKGSAQLPHPGGDTALKCVFKIASC